MHGEAETLTAFTDASVHALKGQGKSKSLDNWSTNGALGLLAQSPF